MSDTIIQKIQNQIDRTLAKRHEFAKRPEKTVNLLYELENRLRVFMRNVLQPILEKTEDTKQKAEYQALIDELRQFTDKSGIADVRKKLEETRTRFDRNFLCVGIVGDHGQGKSKFLQGVTGLEDTIIPTGAGGDLTGAQMVFYNSSELKVKLQLFSPREFVKSTLEPLFNAIELTPPGSIDEFLNYPSSKIEQKRERYKEMVKTIDSLKNAYDDYGRYLTGTTKSIEENEIREWTSKRDENNRPLYKWMAVKLANIYCPFPMMEGVHISVVDTPGMGDSFIPKEGDKLKENFTANVDDVCFFRRINTRGLGDRDDNLYRIVKDALPELDVKDWSHFLVNVFESEKKDLTAQKMLETLRNDFEDPDRRFYGMREHFHEIEVCKGNPPQTNREAVVELFSQIVKDMAENQEKLDEILFKKRNENVTELVRNINAILNKASKLVPKGDGTLSSLELKNLFDPIFNKLYNELKNVVDEKRGKRDSNDEDLAKRIDGLVQDVIKDVENDLASLKEEDIGEPHHFALDKYHELRVRLATKFDDLDIDLEEGMKEIFERLTKIFRETGKLSHLFSNEELPPYEFLQKLSDMLGEINGCEKLSEVIRKLLKTSLSFRIYLLPQVRSTLDPIDYDSGEAPCIEPAVSWEKNKKAILEAFIEAAEACGEKLKKITSKKNQAIFAVVDQLRDGLMFTDGYRYCQSMWMEFYALNQEAIWIEEGHEAKIKRELKREWEEKARDIRDILRQLENC